MKPFIIDKNNDYSTLGILYKGREVHFYVDNEDLDMLLEIDCIVIKNNKGGRLRLVKNNKNTKTSIPMIILGADSAVYLRDTYKSTDKYTLDYRKSNLATGVGSIEGFAEQSRQRFAKQDKEKFYKGLRENRYTKDYAFKLATNKSGENNHSSLLTEEKVSKIRELYENGDVSQYELAWLYDVSRSSIGDIINYRTWIEKDNENIRKFSTDNSFFIEKLSDMANDTFYMDLNCEHVLLNIEDKTKIYIEKLPINRLFYIEVRTMANDFIVSCDIYFPEHLKKKMITNYIISSSNPGNFNKDSLRAYIEMIKRAI